MRDVLASEALSRIDAFYDATLKPRLDAIDDRRRQVRWLTIKSLLIVSVPVGFLIAGDLLDTILPFNSSAGTVAIGFLWLAAACVSTADSVPFRGSIAALCMAAPSGSTPRSTSRNPTAYP